MSAIASEPLGERLRKARTERGWSLAEVARRSGLSRAYVGALELGKGKRPGADAIRRLEDVLGPLGVGGVVGDPPGIPAGLAELARHRRLPQSEVKLLAALRVRGAHPQSIQRWQFIYDALVASEAFEDSSRGEEGGKAGQE